MLIMGSYIDFHYYAFYGEYSFVNYHYYIYHKMNNKLLLSYNFRCIFSRQSECEAIDYP